MMTPMMTHDFVVPFYSSKTAQGDEAHDLAMDLTMVIVKLYFETKGKIEKKLGDLENIAIAYWPFYLVPINANNAYVLEAKGLYGEKVKTKVMKGKMPAIGQYMDESSIDGFIKAIDRFVGEVEKYPGFEREEKKIDGLVNIPAFVNYFVHLFKNARKPYLDSSFSLDPSLTETAVNYTHEEILKIFDVEPVQYLKQQEAEVEKACAAWVAKIEALIAKQEQDPILSLKKKGEWAYPQLADPLDARIATLKEQAAELRAQGKRELVKEAIALADQAINTSSDNTRLLEEHRRNLKNLEDKTHQEKNNIEAERKYWQDAVARIRAIAERMRQAVKGFEDQEKTLRSKFLEERTIAFKTSKVVTCGMPVFLLNFSKKGKIETVVRAPVVLEEVSMFHKNPFQEPKGFNEFEKFMNDWFLKSQNEYEVQRNIKGQDIYSLPNLKIAVSNGIDRLLDLGYLDKKKHKEIRDEEIHQLFTKG